MSVLYRRAPASDALIISTEPLGLSLQQEDFVWFAGYLYFYKFYQWCFLTFIFTSQEHWGVEQNKCPPRQVNGPSLILSARSQVDDISAFPSTEIRHCYHR